MQVLALAAMLAAIPSLVEAQAAPAAAATYATDFPADAMPITEDVLRGDWPARSSG